MQRDIAPTGQSNSGADSSQTPDSNEVSATPLPSTQAESPKNSAENPPRGTRTITSLSLGVEQAEAGRRDLLLPEGFRAKGNTYPIPTERASLCKVASLSLKGAERSGVGWGEYIRRARRSWNALKEERVGARRDEAFGTMQQAVDRGVERVEKLADQAQETVDTLQKKADELFTSLDEINEEVKKGLLDMTRGYNRELEVHGERVGHDTFLSAATKVLNHIARVGGLQKPQDVDDSEAATYKDISDTQARAEESASDAPIPAPGPVAEQ